MEHKNNAPEHSMLQHRANLSIHGIQRYTQLRTDLQNYFMKTTTIIQGVTGGTDQTSGGCSLC